jgi:hypothetical protein
VTLGRVVVVVVVVVVVTGAAIENESVAVAEGPPLSSVADPSVTWLVEVPAESVSVTVAV